MVLYGDHSPESFRKVLHFHSDLNEWTVRPDFEVGEGRIVQDVASYTGLKICNA